MAIWDPPAGSLNSRAGLYQKLGAAEEGSLVFPVNLEKQPFWMSFSFYEYKMPNVVKQDVYYADKGTIRLPLPNSMVDDQKVQYNQEKLETVTGAAIGGLQNKDGGAALAVGAVAGLKGLSNMLNVGGQTGARAVEAIGQAAGVTVNPFLTVMFKNPAFKNHAFEWKLSPSNQVESKELNSIVNKFKANMLPDQTGALGGSLLTYPNIVQITVSANSEDYFTYAFKPAVIESFTVNYTVGGQPSFFGSTKAPTEVSIRLGLMEIEYWLSSDYGQATKNSLAKSLTWDGFTGLFK
jgi:hypothetical protein